MPEPAPRKLTVPPHPLDIIRRKVESPQGPHYEALQGGRVVGIVSKTGTHLDHYPWDWMLLEGVEPAHPGARTVGAADTLAHGLDAIGSALGNFYGRSGWPQGGPPPG